MPYRPLQWARQSVEGRQVEADGARLVNFYAIRPARAVPQEAKVPVMLYGSPGYERYAQVQPQAFLQNGVNVMPEAGIHALLATNTPAYGERLFGIASEYQLFELRASELPAVYRPFDGGALYSLPAARIHNYTVEDSEKATGTVKLVTDGRRVLWVLRRDVRAWDMATDSFVPVPAPIPNNANRNLPDEEWVDAAWVDQYFFLAARGGQFFHSNVANIQFDQLDFASAETKPDGIVALRAQWRRCYVFGTASIERWYNRGGTDFSFARDNGYRHEIGCLNKAALQATEEEMLFIGHDFSVYSIRYDGIPRVVSTPSVTFDLKRADADNAWAWVYTEEDHRFYSLSLPYASGAYKNWTLDLSTRLWHNRTSTDIQACERFGNLNLIGRRGSPYIQSLDLNFGAADGIAVPRIAIAPSLHADRRRVRVHRVDVEAPHRAGGLPADALTLDWSDDGQRTWEGATDRLLDEGTLRYNRLGQFENGRHFRVRTSARRRVDLLGAYAITQVDLP